MQLNVKNTKNPQIKKWTEDQDRHLYKEDISMAKKHMKRYLTSLIIGEIQIKTTVRYHLTLVRITLVQLTLCNPTDCSIPGFPVHHQLLELVQNNVH